MEKKKKFNKQAYDNAFHKKNYKSFSFKLSRISENDLIEKLEKIKDKKAFIKEAIKNYKK